MNSRGVQANTARSWRPPTSGRSTSPERSRGGAQSETEGKGAGSTPNARQAAAAWSVKPRLALSSQSRSSPLTLKTSTRRLRPDSPTMSGRPVSMRRKNRAKEVLVATPLTPEMDICPPLRPSKKSRSTKRGLPSRPSPTGSGRSIWSA